MSNFDNQLEAQRQEDTSEHICSKCGDLRRVVNGCSHEDATLLEYVTEYLVEELERQPRSLLNKPWFAEAMVKVAIEAYEGGAR